MNFLDVSKLLGNLVRAWDKKTGEELDLNYAKIEKIKESDTKPPIFRFIVRDTVYNRQNHIMLKYRCISCDRENCCALNNVMQRVNKGHTWCNMCRDFLNNPTESLKDKIKDDYEEFCKMPAEFKEQYHSRHLTTEEFEQCRPYVLGLQKKRFSQEDLNDYEYVECAAMNEGRHNFMPYLYNRRRDSIERISDINLRCHQCGDEFVSKDFKRHKGRANILCLNCTANLPFCVKDKPFENLEGDTIHFKTRYESKFCRFCNKHCIVLSDGLEIKYKYLHLELDYRIPFYIKKLGLLVDIKDNHNQRNEEGLNADKTACRNQEINNLIQAHPDMFNSYVVLHPGNYVKETRKIVVAYHNTTSFRAFRKTLKKD